ncbi:MAG TPA: 6-phosphogluconolactonase, partial [candidate division Zixibacteria bacterium]|nr:6-phosphogluconolactonase [candidate division Zixibacteria bacterium]
LAGKLGLRPVRAVSRREWECVSGAGRPVYIELCVREPVGGDLSQTGLFDVRFLFTGEPAELVVAPLAPETAYPEASGGIRRSYTIQINGVTRCVFSAAELQEADYILRRLSDSHRRGDYRASLSQALRLIGNARGGRPYRGLRRFPDAERLAHNAAEYFVSVMRDAVIQRGRFTVALSGGSTPIALYRLLSGSVFASCSEWRDTTFLFGDERTVPPEHADSNFRMAQENLFAPLGLDAECVLRMTGESDDLSEAAEAYEREVRRRVSQRNDAGDPVLDLVLLGLGDDGHTASIFPDYPEREIGPEALVASVYVASKKTHRLTLTPRLINAARSIVFLVAGAGKAEALCATLVDGSSAAARIAPDSGRLVFFVDEAATARVEPGELSVNVERW